MKNSARPMSAIPPANAPIAAPAIAPPLIPLDAFEDEDRAAREVDAEVV